MDSNAFEFWMNVAAIVFLVLVLIGVSVAAVIQERKRFK